MDQDLKSKLRSKINAFSFSRLPQKLKEEQLEIAKEKISEIIKHNKPKN
uniref:Uncharacterized protein n=1 Tax=viral metagenome TaxID=1070528 RepID=A0A6C0KRU9_9ZZZZ